MPTGLEACDAREAFQSTETALLERKIARTRGTIVRAAKQLKPYIDPEGYAEGYPAKAAAQDLRAALSRLQHLDNSLRWHRKKDRRRAVHIAAPKKGGRQSRWATG